MRNRTVQVFLHSQVQVLFKIYSLLDIIEKALETKYFNRCNNTSTPVAAMALCP
jgi:hypothetical protein